MSNKITDWSFDKPSEPGLYLMCRGDVETEENTLFLKVRINYGVALDMTESPPQDISGYSTNYKYAKLTIGHEAHE